MRPMSLWVVLLHNACRVLTFKYYTKAISESVIERVLVQVTLASKSCPRLKSSRNVCCKFGKVCTIGSSCLPVVLTSLHSLSGGCAGMAEPVHVSIITSLDCSDMAAQFIALFYP